PALARRPVRRHGDAVGFGASIWAMLDPSPRLLARGVASLLCALACVVPSAALAAQDEPRRPNVVLIVLDTTRPDHLGWSGYARPTTPFLKELGARAAVFDHAFSSSSWTAPSTASVMTGLYPTGHGVTDGMFAHVRDEKSNPDPAEAEKLVLNAI